MRIDRDIYVGGRSWQERLPLPPKALAALAAAVVVFVVAVLVVPSLFGKPEEATLPDLDAADKEAPAPPADAAPAETGGLTADEASAALRALEAAPSDFGISLFTEQGAERTVDPSELPAVQEALAAFNAEGYEASFVIYDLDTGRGLCRNIDADYFSASTIKAPFVAYLDDDLIDEGKANKDDLIYEDVTVEGTGIMADDDEDTYPLETVIYNTIVHSDNTGYALLRESYADGGFEAWAERTGVAATEWEGEEYPFFSARDLAQLWVGVGSYLGTDAACVPWCAELLSQSSNSFIREAVGASAARVLSKPGFEMDTPLFDMGSLNDAGIVVTEGDDYLIALMSDADFDDEFMPDHGGKLTALAAALMDACDQLLHA